MVEDDDALVEADAVEPLDVPEITIKPSAVDAAVKDLRYQKLIRLGLSHAQAQAGSLDGQAYLAARIFHRGS